MAKVFPLFLVFVLAVAVLCFAIPPQEQPANAYVNNDTNIMQYQWDDYTAFINIPFVSGNPVGYKFQFDVNSGYLPFEACYIFLGTGTVLEIELQYFSGVLSLSSPSSDFNFDIEYNTLMPFRLEMVVGQYYSFFRVFIIINSEYIGWYYHEFGSGDRHWSIIFTDGDHMYEPYPYSYWDNPSVSDLAVFYSGVPLTPGLLGRSWVDGANGYDAGYIDGMNAAQTATANIFPAVIGSIFAFFASIASYEILGISLLNIMIIVGSVLLLLAVLRVFLK